MASAYHSVTSRNPRTLVLFELGPVEKNHRWADYLKLGFEEKDVPDLLQLICDKSLRSDEAGTNETWVPMHAWRTLGQLRSAKAVSTLIVLFDHLPYHDWALKDLGTVLGMIGEPAIELLSMSHRRRLAAMVYGIVGGGLTIYVMLPFLRDWEARLGDFRIGNRQFFCCRHM